MPLAIATWTFILLGAMSLLTLRQRAAGLGLLVVGYLLAVVGDRLDGRAACA